MIERSVSIGPLNIRQASLGEDSLRGTYDLCVGVSSWETRAVTAFGRLPPLDAHWEVWSFDSTDPERKAAKAECVARMMAERPEPLTSVGLATSLQYEQNFRLIESRLADASRRAGGPLDLLFDMTCMPKKYMLFLLGSAFRNEFVRSVDFVYAEGAYLEPAATDALEPMSWSSTEGDWSSVQVPYLEADNFMPDTRSLIVSLGAEISASVPFIERYEPRRISLMSVDDDPRRIDAEVVKKDRRLLKAVEALPITDSQSAALEDALLVAERCLSFCREEPEVAVTGLAIGAKPHALALGVVALSVPNLEIVCRLPSKYLSGDVVPTGQVFVYSVEDRFEPR